MDQVISYRHHMKCIVFDLSLCRRFCFLLFFRFLLLSLLLVSYIYGPAQGCCSYNKDKQNSCGQHPAAPDHLPPSFCPGNSSSPFLSSKSFLLSEFFLFHLPSSPLTGSAAFAHTLIPFPL